MRTKSARTWLLLLASALLSARVKAQNLPCVQQTLPVGVSDIDGRLVTGLAASNFRVRVHGRDATILSANTDGNARRIALLLDASGSMLSEPGPWKPTLTIAKTLVESLHREDSLAFMIFASQVERKIDFTQDRRLIVQALDDLQPATKVIPKNARKTALWDSVLEAFRLFDSAHAGDAIYVISDGDDNHSQASRGDVERALLAAGIRFYSLLPPNINIAGGPRTTDTELEMERQPRKNLEDLADNTGGALFTVYDTWINGARVPLKPSDLQTALNQLNALTGQFYRLEIELPQPFNKNRGWQVEVVDQTRKGKLPLIVRYPHKLVPCKTITR